MRTDADTFCVYDRSSGTPSTLFRATVPPGTNWQATTGGFKYRDDVGIADGVTGTDLKAGADEMSRITVSARGSRLTLPSLPLPLPLTVQLRGHGECWGAEYRQDGVRKNSGTDFVGKSSPSGAFLDPVGGAL